MEKLSAAINKARQQRLRKSKTSSGDEFVFDRNEKAEPSLDVADFYGKIAELTPNQFIKKSSSSKNSILVAQGLDSAPFDLLRTRIIQQCREHNWRRVAVVSARSGSGKSTVTANLTASLSRQEDIRSLVLDFDLRRATLAKAFETKPENSFADVLTGIKEFSQSGYRLNQNVVLGLGVGTIERSSEVLQHSKTKSILKKLETTYEPHITLIDMPPLFQTDDTFGFLSEVDCALIIAEAGRTNIKQLDLAEKQTSELTNVLGVVLNKCRYVQSDFTNDYSYYY